MAKIQIETTKKFANVQVINVDVNFVARVMRMYNYAKASFIDYKESLDEGCKLTIENKFAMDAYELISDLGDAFLGENDEEEKEEQNKPAEAI